MQYADLQPRTRIDERSSAYQSRCEVLRWRKSGGFNAKDKPRKHHRYKDQRIPRWVRRAMNTNKRTKFGDAAQWSKPL